MRFCPRILGSTARSRRSADVRAQMPSGKVRTTKQRHLIEAVDLGHSLPIPPRISNSEYGHQPPNCVCRARSHQIAGASEGFERDASALKAKTCRTTN